MEFSAAAPSRSRAFVALLAAIIVAYAALVVAQARTRKPWNDEAMSASAGLSLATHGYLAIPPFDDHDPNMHGIHRHMYYIMPFQPVVMALWYKIVGFSLFKTRVLSMLWTVVFYFALFRLMSLLTASSVSAWLALALTASDYQIISAAAFGRYDTMVAALGFSAYAIFLTQRQQRFMLAIVAANTCVAAAGFTHPNGLLYAVGLWFLILYHDWRKIRIQHLAAASAPYLVGGAAWGLYILQDVPDFKTQLFGNTGNRVGLFHPWTALRRELEFRYGWPYGLGPQPPGRVTPLIRLKALALLGYLTGILGSLLTPALRRAPGMRVLLLLTGIHMLYFTFYEGMKFNYYLVHLLPFYLTLLAVFVHHLWLARARLRPLAAIGVASLIAVGVGGILMRVRVNDMGKSFAPAVAFIKQNAGPGDMIFATCSFGFGIGFGPNLVDDGSFGYYSGFHPRYIVMEEIYEDNVNLHRARFPQVYDYYVKLMTEYKQVYDQGGYKILERTTPGTPVEAVAEN